MKKLLLYIYSQRRSSVNIKKCNIFYNMLFFFFFFLKSPTVASLPGLLRWGEYCLPVCILSQFNSYLKRTVFNKSMVLIHT